MLKTADLKSSSGVLGRLYIEIIFNEEFEDNLTLMTEQLGAEV